MTSNLTTFNFGSNEVRTVTIDGEPWFVGKDICDVLGYKNASDAINDHCRGIAKRYPILDRLGRSQETRVISESDMMRLIIGSKLPAAQKFESWVFEEVLPAIRKTGTYSVSQPAPAQSPVFLTMPPVLEALQVSNMLADVLNLHGTSRTAMINDALKIKAPEYLSLMPAYATNAPRTMSGKLLGGEGNSLPAFAATSLLKKFNSISTITFNKLAEEYGFLETRERPSSRHENVAKTYKAITTKGLEFGYNLSNEFSKGSVSPVWFESKFPELLDIICY